MGCKPNWYQVYKIEIIGEVPNNVKQLLVAIVDLVAVNLVIHRDLHEIIRCVASNIRVEFQLYSLVNSIVFSKNIV